MTVGDAKASTLIVPESDSDASLSNIGDDDNHNNPPSTVTDCSACTSIVPDSDCDASFSNIDDDDDGHQPCYSTMKSTCGTDTGVCTSIVPDSDCDASFSNIDDDDDGHQPCYSTMKSTCGTDTGVCTSIVPDSDCDASLSKSEEDKIKDRKTINSLSENSGRSNKEESGFYDKQGSLEGDSTSIKAVKTANLVYVHPTNNSNKRRRYDKRDSCLFCKSLVGSTNLMKHMLRRHQSEEEVKELQKLAPLSIARKRCMQVIRNKGNFRYNKNVLENGGSLLVCNRPAKEINVTKDINAYLSCSSCYGFYARREISRHRCPASFDKFERIRTSGLVNCGQLSYDVILFLNRMNHDHISQTAMNDTTLLEFIRQQLDLKGMAGFQSIASKVRLLCELLLKYREMYNDHSLSLSSILLPECIKRLQSCIKQMFAYSTGGQVSLERPSSFIRLIQTLPQIIKVLRIEALKESNWKQAKVWNNVPVLFEHLISPLAQNCRKSMKSHALGIPQQLPEISTINAFANFLDRTIACTSRTMDNHRILSEAVLARLILFNKRRSSEVAKIHKTDWDKRNQWKQNCTKDLANLDETEKVMVKENEIVYVIGKGRKHVPVIFPGHVTAVVEWLVENSSNGYVFPNKANGHLRGHDTVRSMVKRSCIDGNLTSTNFRKLAATVLQLEDFTESEYRLLCDHLGHTPEVHKRYYRLRDTTTELTKVAKMLHKADKTDDTTLMEGFESTTEVGREATSNKPGPSTSNRAEITQSFRNRRPAKRWTQRQTEYLRTICAKHLSHGITIRKGEAQRIAAGMPTLFNRRTWQEIRDKIRYETMKMKK